MSLVSRAKEVDNVVRAITDDGAFRVITVRTTETVRGAIAAQGAKGNVARVFADLLTATILVRETMSPDLRVQGILQSADTKSRMVADSHPDGATRGLVQVAPTVTDVRLAPGGVMQMMRSLHNGTLHHGIVEVPNVGGVGGALMQYMQVSEQVVSMIALGTIMTASGDDVIVAGGYIVQLLPEASDGPLMLMTERLKDFENIDPLLLGGKAEPEELLAEILYGMHYSRVGAGTVRFHCPCSEARVVASLATLPRHEIESFIADGKLLEIACDYCKREYAIAPEKLRGLLQKN
jgi:molecular chaperone Hsp33